MNKIALLKRVPIFKKISLSELKKIAKIATLKKFSKEENIFKEGQRGDSLYIVAAGLIEIFKISSFGRIKILAFLEKGNFFGEMAILEGRIRSANARAVKDSETLVISRRDFERTVKENPSIGLKITETLSQRLREADRQIEILSFQNVLGRVAITLLDLASTKGVRAKEGVKINMEITHQKLADMVGTAREMVSRALGLLKRNNCIKIDKSYVTITNRKELKNIIC